MIYSGIKLASSREVGNEVQNYYLEEKGGEKE